ncbi:MAG: prepilin-type N-terminal cleavage/methylation domain-containing protein [bacterium]|nr:prepilin-type N-terminal cleavage/methylation domain-containing protein [bacterium]
MKQGQFGFTLIELLIVVAIIGILAAIAVPNFLNAQVRAKVAKAVSNMRTVQNALEAYQLDKSTYPRWAWDSSNPRDDYMGFRDLTTPVAYLSGDSAFRNPFKNWTNSKSVQGDSREVDPYFELSTFQVKGSGYDPNAWPRQAWLLESSGPDIGDDYNAGNFPVEGLVYQPSNGVLSRGDLFRAGGAKTPSWAQTLTY